MLCSSRGHLFYDVLAARRLLQTNGCNSLAIAQDNCRFRSSRGCHCGRSPLRWRESAHRRILHTHCQSGKRHTHTYH